MITGSNGLLGQKLVKLFESKMGFQVHAISRGQNRLHAKEGYTYYDLDLLKKEELIKLLDQITPDIIIHTAAMTNVDACELHQEECDHMNIDMVKNILSYCQDKDIYLVHLSTDFIFDGEKGSYYNEEDVGCPVNYYGLSKLKSEFLIQASNVPHAILRTVLVYGHVDLNDRSNIVLWVKKSLESKENIRVVTDQLRMPTYAEDLAEACWLAINQRAQGVFNVSSNELMSIYEIAVAVADSFGLNQNLIEPVETAALSLPAKRPLSTGFDLNKSITVLKLPSYSFRERLQVFKNQLANLNVG